MEEIISGKRCKKCGLVKQFDRFSRDVSSRDGRCSRCKDCEAERQRLYFGEYSEKCHKASRKWRTEHPEQYHESNRKSSRKWDVEHPERVREHKKRWRMAHIEQVRKRSCKSSSKWYAAHLEQAREICRRRRAAKLGVENALTASEWRETLSEYNNMCAYCNTKTEKLHQDHVIPISKGGSHTKDNVVPACPSCNFSKGNKTLILWLYQRAQT